jgi:hypothetical protein
MKSQLVAIVSGDFYLNKNNLIKSQDLRNEKNHGFFVVGMFSLHTEFERI